MAYESKAMSNDLMHYQELVEHAMKNVVREVLSKVAESGLPGDHHLYITFRTTHAGVVMADRLMAQYPEEMTIVLQHQFWDLKITEDYFFITLSFSGKGEHLTIPFEAILGFADPSVNFGLHFKAGHDKISSHEPPDDNELVSDEELEEKETASANSSINEIGQDTENISGEVVALDAFRKNKN